MEIIYVNFGVIILCSLFNLILTKPFGEENSLNDYSNKLHCMDSNEGGNYERSNTNYFSDYTKPRSKFEDTEKYPMKPYEYDKKRSILNEMDNDADVTSLRKRQVGVVYKDDKPIGILQPFQRSYRFIPVRDDSLNEQSEALSYNLPGITDVDKRELSSLDLDTAQFDDSYPSILTNFKIDNKLDKKRNYDAFTEENVRDLKATIRRLRSANSRNSEQIEEKLKNILDDMGLIEDEESHEGKREVPGLQTDNENMFLTQNEKDRRKRFDPCTNSENSEVVNQAASEHNFLSSADKTNEVKSEVFSQKIDKRESTDDSKESRRKKRQKQENMSGLNKGNSVLTENLKNSGDQMLSGNKWATTSGSEVEVRETDTKELGKQNEDDDYEKRVERQIQSKINSLKEEVKREIEALKNADYDDDEDDIQRKKRQVLNNLIDEESEEIDPALNPDGELKPLIRKRRHTNSGIRKKRETEFSFDSRSKRKSDHSSDIKNKRNYKSPQEENDESGDLLGGDDFSDGSISKRQIYDINQDYQNFNLGNPNNEMLYERDKRSNFHGNNLDLYGDYFYNDKYFYDNNDRLKRGNIRENKIFGEDSIQEQLVPLRREPYRSRLRRRINTDLLIPNRPQQLSDMSDLDLFGALPKSYNGELSRYKRVKRK